METSEKLRQIPAGAQVDVYRYSVGKWMGPNMLISITGETTVVQTGRGRRIFRSTCVRPFINYVMRQDEPTDNPDEDGLTD